MKKHTPTQAAVASIMLSRGYTPADTGGGYTGWRKDYEHEDLPNDTYFLITFYEDSMYGDPDKKEWMAGLYYEGNPEGHCFSELTLHEAVSDEIKSKLWSEFRKFTGKKK